MTQQPLTNASLWWNRALTLTLILPGLVVAANLDAGTGLGESAHSVVLGLAPMVVLAAQIALVVWVIAPGDHRLSRAGRAKVGRTVRSGAAIDDAGLASAVVKRADATVQRLEHQLENRNRRRVGGALFMIPFAVLVAGSGFYWLAGYTVLVAGYLAWRAPQWDEALASRRDAARAAGAAARRRLTS